MKTYIYMLLLLGGMATPVLADSERRVVINEPVKKTTVINRTYKMRGAASILAAAQHNFDYGVHSWQGSMGVGVFDGSAAVSFGVAKRHKNKLFNFSVSGNKSLGMGINFRF